ncbi:hypothetical protein CLV41_11858 [Roseibium marinum]|uniref:VOC domain-containing protein n=1 Tax=Roseibium marinum TaxID=281252 RepID=A0A2S3UK07_9HYPH|nr:hypothetical protein CLV41_11858 [Roseibium marinum]
MERSAAFYALHFGFSVHQSPADRITELIPPGGGTRLLLHKAGKAQKLGQAAVKLVFDIEDIPGFCETAKSHGLVFGSLHQADGYQFANAKDPDGNTLQVSSRAYRQIETI